METNFHQSWKSFLSKKTILHENESLDEIKNIVLNEISYDSYERIKDWMTQASQHDYSFDNMFGNDWRVRFPLKTFADNELSSISDMFLHAGFFDTDFAAGTVKSLKASKNGSVERINKIGKVLNKLLQFSKKLREIYDDDETTDYRVVDAHKEVFKKYVGVQVPYPQIPDLRQIESAVKFWNTKSEYYRTNPEQVRTIGKYEVIVSRHPIDVLRMSDFQTISSCHSEGNSYFSCAMGEAKGHGPVAYVVKSEDAANIEDLQADEIFTDDQRNVNPYDVEPIFRTRLRKFTNNALEYDLAIPETATYGIRIPGALEAIVDWAYDAQKEYIEEMDPDVELNEHGELADLPTLSGFVRRGGSYSDTPASSLFNNFFINRKKTKYEYYRGDVMDDTEDDGDNENELMYEQYEDEREVIQHRANNILNVSLYSETHQEFDEAPYIVFGAEIIFYIKIADLGLSDKDISFLQKQNSRLYSDFLAVYSISREFADLDFHDFYVSDVDLSADVVDKHYEHYFEIRIIFESGTGTPDDMEDYVANLESIGNDEDKEKEVKILLLKLLEEGGFLPKNEFSNLKALYHNEEIVFNNFEVNDDDDEFIFSYVDKNNPILYTPSESMQSFLFRAFDELFLGDEQILNADYAYTNPELTSIVQDEVLSLQQQYIDDFSKQLTIPGVEPVQIKKFLTKKTKTYINPFAYKTSSVRHDDINIFFGLSIKITFLDRKNVNVVLNMVKFLDKNIANIVQSGTDAMIQLLTAQMEKEKEKYKFIAIETKKIVDWVLSNTDDEYIIKAANNVVDVIVPTSPTSRIPTSREVRSAYAVFNQKVNYNGNLEFLNAIKSETKHEEIKQMLIPTFL